MANRANPPQRRLILLAGAVALIVAACGGQPAAQLPATDGKALFTYISQTRPYKQWGTWPKDQWNDFTTLLKSGAPHGGVVRIYVNDIALNAARDFKGQLPEGSIIVKENYTGNDPASPGNLDALTVMYKVKGYDPEHNDWFWLKVTPDGKVDAEGKVGMCYGCHAQEGNKDYVLRYGFGSEPAVISAATEPQQMP
ncbi:MAG: hypothetical protein C4310_01895 [Chloroflexota bacterium]